MSKANEARKKHGVTHCYWCRLPFTSKRKASYDHVHPVISGKRAGTQKVFSCNACNWCRGDMPFEDYEALVAIEHERARLEHRRYERPRNQSRPSKLRPLRGFNLEQGNRVSAHMRMENSQSPSQKRKFIIKVARKAQHMREDDLEIAS